MVPVLRTVVKLSNYEDPIFHILSSQYYSESMLHTLPVYEYLTSCNIIHQNIYLFAVIKILLPRTKIYIYLKCQMILQKFVCHSFRILSEGTVHSLYHHAVYYDQNSDPPYRLKPFLTTHRINYSRYRIKNSLFFSSKSSAYLFYDNL